MTTDSLSTPDATALWPTPTGASAQHACVPQAYPVVPASRGSCRPARAFQAPHNETQQEHNNPTDRSSLFNEQQQHNRCMGSGWRRVSAHKLGRGIINTWTWGLRSEATAHGAHRKHLSSHQPTNQPTNQCARSSSQRSFLIIQPNPGKYTEGMNGGG